jgi:DNA mismatch repair protein MutL
MSLAKKMDCIKLLPDNIANQIAAGEVVQRPASVIKELLENALDAKATQIKVIIKEGGSSLIQIIDNGVGMSITDARMCWERHATSKISQADDLFRLKSFGFRGEALASIAAIAHVEMKTKRKEDEVGTFIRIEGSKVIEQSPVATVNGTQFSIKNLFYNVPARRNFLKSVPVEMRHIIDEFVRVAMPHSDVAFSLYHNDKEVFVLNSAKPEQRIADLLGKKNSDDFLIVDETHEYLNVKGFVGKPEMAKKTRGEQFIFVNQRFIKDAYINHAIVNAYDQLIAKDQFPFYVLFLSIDPAHIDVNIHPTKTEIKFDEERMVYTLVKSAIKKALGQYTAMPDLEFANPHIFSPLRDLGTSKTHHIVPEPKIDKGYNPFKSDTQERWKPIQSQPWHQLFENPYLKDVTNQEALNTQKSLPIEHQQADISDCLILPNGYLVAIKNNQLIIVDQRAAHERILYEKYCQNILYRSATVQQLLFPRTIELSHQDYVLAHEIMEDIKDLGFDVADFGNNCLIINGVPAETLKGSEKELLESLIESFKNNSTNIVGDKRQVLALAMAQNEAIYRTKTLENEQAIDLLVQLFKCETPATRPNGKPVYIELGQQKITDFFN